MNRVPLRRRVLIVDDEPLIRWSLGEILSDQGWNVTEACDRRAAIEALATAGSFDVVLLDLRLPDSNDLALLADVRRLAPASQVILMTAFGAPEVVQQALDLGAYRVVGKPFEVADVATLVSQAQRSTSR
jgi:DNA-binding NtrC family response regulator